MSMTPRQQAIVSLKSLIDQKHIEEQNLREKRLPSDVLSIIATINNLTESIARIKTEYNLP
jgi:hypothetical protein